MLGTAERDILSISKVKGAALFALKLSIGAHYAVAPLRGR
jgi:hypothetical protein